jgi:hypothetical protein
MARALQDSAAAATPLPMEVVRRAAKMYRYRRIPLRLQVMTKRERL